MRSRRVPSTSSLRARRVARFVAVVLVAAGAIVVAPGILAETTSETRSENASETTAGSASDSTSETRGVDAGHSLEHRMTMLALQIGIILFAGYFGSRMARRLKIPVILGELVAGILIGPFAFGTIALPGYPDGLFPRVANSLSISPELYGFAVVASIVLLFLMGLQTDLRLFLRFAVKGSVVGLGGAILSVFVGIFVGWLMLGAEPGDPRSLFLGVVAIATSVDITGRILSERHKMASPEGVTILSASVIEDVMGITLLAIVLGIDALETSGSDVDVWREIVGIGGRALVVWLGFTTLGIVFSHRISGRLKSVQNPAQIAVLSLGLALILAGLFEAAGLAMIIGAYVMGLSLANTDIAYVVQEKIETVHQFFDPIFFTVMGMLIDVFVLASGEVILFGLLFGVLAAASKLIGVGLTSLGLGFTGAGALRVAMGMVPRGEVALVIASIGLGSGLLDARRTADFQPPAPERREDNARSRCRFRHGHNGLRFRIRGPYAFPPLRCAYHDAQRRLLRERRRRGAEGLSHAQGLGVHRDDGNRRQSLLQYETGGCDAREQPRLRVDPESPTAGQSHPRDLEADRAQADARRIDEPRGRELV
ncbi:MAG: cation:proton antiporter [Spirochaetota bacterium]